MLLRKSERNEGYREITDGWGQAPNLFEESSVFAERREHVSEKADELPDLSIQKLQQYASTWQRLQSTRHNI